MSKSLLSNLGNILIIIILVIIIITIIIITIIIIIITIIIIIIIIIIVFGPYYSMGRLGQPLKLSPSITISLFQPPDRVTWATSITLSPWVPSPGLACDTCNLFSEGVFNAFEACLKMSASAGSCLVRLHSSVLLGPSPQFCVAWSVSTVLCCLVRLYSSVLLGPSSQFSVAWSVSTVLCCLVRLHSSVLLGPSL